MRFCIETDSKGNGGALIFLSPAVGGLENHNRPVFTSDLPANTLLSYYAFQSLDGQPARDVAIGTMKMWKKIHITAPDTSRVMYDTDTTPNATAVFETFSTMVGNVKPVMCTPLLLMQPGNLLDANVTVAFSQEPINKHTILLVYTLRPVKYGEIPTFALWEYTTSMQHRRLKAAWAKKLGFDVQIEPGIKETQPLRQQLAQCRKDCIRMDNNKLVLLSILGLCERLFEAVPLNVDINKLAIPQRPSAQDVLQCSAWSRMDKIECKEVDVCKAETITHSLQFLLCFYVVHEAEPKEALVLLGFMTRLFLHFVRVEWTEPVGSAIALMHQISAKFGSLVDWWDDWEPLFQGLQMMKQNTHFWARSHVRCKTLY